MARHNREGEGVDQRGFSYRISYAPDWLRHVKVSRDLPSGRRSTMTLFRNPQERGEGEPGDQVRTRITCAEQGVDLEVVVRCCRNSVSRVVVTCRVPRVPGPGEEELGFVLEDGLDPPADA
ncbi:MAG: hypothetical protein EA350_07370 [Gemmatimonadales bacterium]|nr:MAG: hypothetical protein EA350_07370 [Gemmatimonadales bacterium]